MALSLDYLTSVLRLNPNSVQPSTSTFPRVATDSIAHDLKINAEAEKRGKADQPPASATRLDIIENAIVEAVGSIRRDGLNTYSAEMRAYADRMSGMDIDGYVSQISNSLRDGIHEFRERVHLGVDQLYAHRDQLKELKVELDDFRATHRLRRPARYPTSHILHSATIAAILLADALANGYFFMQANELGLAGGVLTAIILASINVFFCGMFGYLSRYANHRSFFLKMLGLGAILLFFGFMVYFNLFIGHFREAASLGDWQTAAQSGVKSFLANQIGLSVFDSWILVLLGAMFGIVAFVDGLKWDDPYPAFGSLWRRWRSAIATYVEEKTELLHTLRDRKDRTLDEIDAARQEIADRVKNYLQASEFRTGLKLGLPVFLEDTERAVNLLLSEYREINVASRDTQAPAYFHQEFKFPNSDVQHPESFLELGRSDIAQLTERADKLLVEHTREMLKEFQKAFEQYDQISTVIQEITGNGKAA